MHPPDRKQPSRLSLLRGEADDPLFAILLPYNFSLHMYKFPSAGDDSCLSVVYTDNVYHWAVLDYFHTCLFYTVHRPTGLVLRLTCLTDVCGNQLEATDCLTPLQSALEKGGGASVTNRVSK